MTHALSPSEAAPLRCSWAAFALISVLTLLRLWFSTTLDLFQDEAHYWQWSRHLDLSYFDQGPGIALCVRLGTLLFGDTPLGVRCVNVLLNAGTGWLAYKTASRWSGPVVGFWTLVLLSFSPLLAAGGVLATYDSVQVFFWVTSLYALTVTVQTESVRGWYAVGVLVGLGCLCKVTMLLFAPCVLIFLLISPRFRHWLSTPHPYLAFGTALLLFSPVILWNADHDWVNLRHAAALTNRSRNAPPFRWFGEFLGGQMLVLGPFLFIAELFILGKIARSGNRMTDANRFYTAFGAPILVLCLLMSLRSKLEINWPVPTHIAGVMAVAAAMTTLPLIRWRAIMAMFLIPALLMSLVIFVPDVLPRMGLRVRTTFAQKPLEPYGWHEIAGRVQEERERLLGEGKPVFMAGTNYRVNSILGFYLPDHPTMVPLYLGTRRDQFLFWSRPEDYIGENAILVLSEKDEEAAALARQIFSKVEEMPAASVTRQGFSGLVKDWRIYRCLNFKGYDIDRFAEGY
ncbi:MAG: glycosyltransferase family 39 protein [Armatimonadota bacterium]